MRRKWSGSRACFAAVVGLWVGACSDGAESIAPEARCRTTVAADGVTDSVGQVRWRVASEFRSELDAWCAGVGPARVGSFAPAADTGDARRGSMHDADMAGRPVLDSLLVVAWNVHVGGGDLVGMITRLRAGEFTRGVPVRHFAILLQETFQASAAVPPMTEGVRSASHIDAEPPGGGARRPIDEVARELGLSYVYAPSMRNGEVPAGSVHEDRGNAIISTLELADPWALELPVERQRRVAVVADVSGRTSPGVPWRLQLASAHLETLTRRSPLGITARLRQARWLLSALPPAGRAVLGGDFNSRFGAADEAAVRRVRSEYPEPATTPSFRTYDGPLLTGQVDFIFARGVDVTGYRRIDDAFGSDHWPVLAWVRF